MEDQPNESYEEKADLEKHEIPQDTLVNNQNQEILTRNEIPQNQEIKNEEDKENSEAKKAEEEQNEEELNEMDDNANEENEGEDVNENEEHEENNENQEEEENNDEIKDNNEEIIEENKENNENNEDVEPDENEENQEEANSDNNEEEDSHKNQPEEQQQNEYKERQAIHIHRENEEDHEQNNSEEEENIEESGKIHPIEENSEDKEEIRDEENVENKILQKVEKEQEKRILLESTELDAQGEEGKEKEEQAESHKEYSKKKSEPLDGESQKQDTEHITHISHKIEKKIKTNQKNIPNIMVFEKYQSERSSLINENSVDRDVQVIERKLDINNIDFKTLVEIPINERYKYENKEIISLQGGMAPGEYKFEGEEIELRHKEPGFGSVEITKEEIMNEINKRNVKSKEKKISYEIVDRYYYVPIYGEKFEKIMKIIKPSPEDNYSKYLLEQINKIRTDPKSFIGVIEDAKDNIKINKEGICYYKSNKLKVCLNEGESAFNDSIEFLKNCQPMEPLEFSPSLIPDLPTTVNEMNNINYLKISIKKMMNDGLKINSYWRNVIKDPEICFLLMIVDDSDKSKGMKRVDILNPKMKYIGLSSVEMDKKFMNYIVLSE
jgi:hypothetical protein